LPNAFHELIKRLAGTREGDLPALQTFPALNIDQIAGELRIAERATASGSHNHPSQESTAEDVIESDIRQYIDGRARKAQDDYQAQISLYEGRIRRVLFSADLGAEITGIGEKALGDFKRVASNDRDYLNNARREVEGAEKELEAFKQSNKLQRMPKVISQNEKWARWILILILIIFESILNGLFFAQGSEKGLIGGVFQALVFSILNVGVAVLLAIKAFPQINHINNGRKLLGVIALAVYAWWAISFNLFIGHFRDMYVQVVGQVAANDLIQRLFATPFGFVEARSLILVMLGILLSIIAFIDAYGFEDRYPGYGYVGKRYQQASLGYAARKESCLTGLTDRRDKAMDDFQTVINAIKNAEMELRLALEGRLHLHRQFQAYLRHLEDSYFNLIQRYHESNIQSRTEPPPPRFLQRPTKPDFLCESTLGELPDLTNDNQKQVVNKLECFIKAISQRYDVELDQYRTIVELTKLGDTDCDERHSAI
jgi:hypothetical protein